MDLFPETMEESRVEMIEASGGPLSQVKEEDRDGLKLLRKYHNPDDPYMYSLRAASYLQILFKHSLQNFGYSMSLGRAINFEAADPDRSNIVMNVLLSHVEAFQALLLAKTPRRQAIAMTRDDRDIESARYIADYLEWTAESMKLEKKSHEAANLLASIGSVVAFVGWDPSEGRRIHLEDGTFISEGDQKVDITSLFEVDFHPFAKSPEDSQYAYRIRFMPKDWFIERWPERADEFEEMANSTDIRTDDSRIFQRSLLNLGPGHDSPFPTGSGSADVPENEGYIEYHELYLRSGGTFENGWMATGAGVGGDATMILDEGENPYIDHRTGRRRLPFVLMNDLEIPNRLWGEGRILHHLPHQKILNSMWSGWKDSVDRTAYPKMYYSEEGVAPESVTDEPGSMIPVGPGSQPPGYIPPPELPAFFMQGFDAVLQFQNQLSSSIGMGSGEDNMEVRSGVHQMIVEEAKQLRVAPTIRKWEMFWDEVNGQLVDNWRTFASTPRKIGVVGDDGGWRETYFSGRLASENVVVRIEPYSAMPTSRTAVFAEWVELIKSGAAPVQADPILQKRMWSDLGKDDMARTIRDQSLDIDKARRNLQAVRLGQTRVWEPQDDINIHLSVYEGWMKTPEYEAESKKNPMLRGLLFTLLSSFERAQAQQAMREAAMMGMAGGGPPGFQSPQEARVQGAAAAATPGGTGGDAGEPRATNGFGRAMSAMRDARGGLETGGTSLASGGPTMR